MFDAVHSSYNGRGMKSFCDECIMRDGSAHNSRQGCLEMDAEQSPQTWLEMIAYFWEFASIG
jgi:hypothetical protein